MFGESLFFFICKEEHEGKTAMRNQFLATKLSSLRLGFDCGCVMFFFSLSSAKKSEEANTTDLLMKLQTQAKQVIAIF